MAGCRPQNLRSGNWINDMTSSPSFTPFESISADNYLLNLKNVEVTFNGVIQVLHSVNLTVAPGQIVAFLGGNGAGKSTTLKAISSLLEIDNGRVTGGSIQLYDKNITNIDPASVVRLGISQVLEGRKVFAHLTVEQNLLLGTHLHSDRKQAALDREFCLNIFPALRHLLSRQAGYLSGGEMQMLLVSRALLLRPRLLLLDEPSIGLAPLLVKEIFDALLRINRGRGLAILLVEQNAMAALRIADYAYVIENGRIVLHGKSADLRSNEDIREFYLGLSTNDKENKSFRNVKHYKRRKRWLG